VLTLPGRFFSGFPALSSRRASHHETYISAEQSPTQEDAWLSRPHGDQERSQGARAAACQGPQEADPVALAPRACPAPGNAIAASDADPPPRTRLGFPPRARLRKAGEFEALRARGRRVHEGCFTARLRANDLGHARLGLAIAVKLAGNAVERNRIRRVIRESFRLHQPELPAVDVVVGAGPKVRDAPNPALRAALDVLWRKVTAACAASQPS